MKDGDGRALLLAVRQELDDRWPYRDRGQPVPAGLRLEIAPLVANHLLTDPSLDWPYNRVREAKAPSDQISEKFSLPVLITKHLGLDPLAWRLVIVTEEVLKSGRLS